MSKARGKHFRDELLNLTFKEHLLELRRRVLYTILVFVCAFGIGYLASDHIYQFLLKPLAQYYASTGEQANIIYTGLTEAFFSYLRLASYFATFCTLPFFATQLYLFISPALHKNARKCLLPYLFMTPLLFVLGAFVAYYWIFPSAWQFFLGFETVGHHYELPIKLEARISEYLSLCIEIMIGFGLAFQLPVLLTLLSSFGLISIEDLKRKRRLAIVIIFIIAAIITPPDVLSQLILAGIMIVLYEISILSCKFIKYHARHKLDKVKPTGICSSPSKKGRKS